MYNFFDYKSIVKIFDYGFIVKFPNINKILINQIFSGIMTGARNNKH